MLWRCVVSGWRLGGYEQGSQPCGEGQEVGWAVAAVCLCVAACRDSPAVLREICSVGICLPGGRGQGRAGVVALSCVLSPERAAVNPTV